MGRLWVLAEGLNVSDPLDELGAEGSMILKQVVNTQGSHLDIVDLLRTRPRTVGVLKILRIYLPEEEPAASQKRRSCL